MPRSGRAQIICTVDVVLLTLSDNALHVLLHERPRDPFAGQLALPGGYVHADEDDTAWHAAERVLREKTGIASPYLEQLATWSGQRRDPRGWSVSVVYYALVPARVLQTLGEGSRLARVDALPRLPFDHAEIVAHAVTRVRQRSQYSSLPVYLCDDEFTLPELQSVYEAVLGTPLNKVSFRRKIEELSMLLPVLGKLTGGAHRPAQVYRLKPAYRRVLATVERGLGS